MKTRMLALTLMTAALATGCANQSQTNQTATGAGTGAVVGGILGNIIGGNTRGTVTGAAIGAALGGTVGYNWGKIRGDVAKDTAGTGAEITEQQDGSLKVNIPSSVSFDTNSYAVKPTFRGVLDNLSQTLNKYPELNAHIVGHTDNVGSAAYNQTLSQERATSVLNYLADQGVNRTRMSAEGRGLTQPIADNATEAGRAQNRRVEIYLKPIQR